MSKLNAMILASLLMDVSTLCAQNVVEAKTNLMRNGDVISMQRMEFSWNGERGEEQIWDFSSAESLGSKRLIEFQTDSVSNFQQIDGQAICGYILDGDLLKLQSYENRLEKICYDDGKAYMRYPLLYGDSIVSNFKGHGRYCGDHKINVEGRVLLHADACGTLILSEKDTLRNALRVYTLTTTSMAIDMDSAVIDPGNLKQEIEEKYDWYVSGYRYPLYETVVRTSYSNLAPVASQCSAYRLLPDEIDMQPDEVNDRIKEEQKEKQQGDGYDSEAQPDIIHYNVDVNGSDVTLNYTLDSDGTVSIVIADVTGYVCKQTKRATKAGEHVSIDFDCSNMKRERCVLLYINVNGKVYSEKVTIK